MKHDGQCGFSVQNLFKSLWYCPSLVILETTCSVIEVMSFG